MANTIAPFQFQTNFTLFAPVAIISPKLLPLVASMTPRCFWSPFDHVESGTMPKCLFLQEAWLMRWNHFLWCRREKLNYCPLAQLRFIDNLEQIFRCNFSTGIVNVSVNHCHSPSIWKYKIQYVLVIEFDFVWLTWVWNEQRQRVLKMILCYIMQIIQLRKNKKNE